MTALAVNHLCKAFGGLRVTADVNLNVAPGERRLIIGPNGAIQSSLVKASSGYEILDSQAMDMVKKAKPLTPIPAALRGREFMVDIPVIFDLQAG